MGKSPFIDAIEALEEIRAFCERREKAYEGWSATEQSAEYDLKQIRKRAEDAISTLQPSPPTGSINKEQDHGNRSITYKGTFE